jgi:transcriptional regulator with GAF, ATPase, and Fis domain
MHAIRSLLWIGSAERFPAGALTGLPTVDVVWERDVPRARSHEGHAFDAVVLDADDPDGALLGLAALRDAPRQPPVLVRVDADAEDRRGELTAAGASLVLLASPGEADEAARATIVDGLARLHARRRGEPLADVEARLSADPPSAALVGRSPAMRRVYALVARAARSRATVLVSGETGTGKELIARAIHDASERHARPCVAVNCAAFPETLLESELLGHTRGAFTGAERPRRGLFEEADGGTLFLDEVGETSPGFQAKLLRVLQERVVRPLGGGRPRRVDVRLVAATNRDLNRDVASGRFREDLYYRLAVFPIEVPPLRERPGDLISLTEHFLARHGRAEGVPGCALAPDAARLLQLHRWPGNVRELENEILRALALAEPGETLTPGHFSERLRGAFAPLEAARAEIPAGETLRDTMDRLEAWLVRRALERHQGRRNDTARHLGLTREGLYKKMQRLGIE